MNSTLKYTLLPLTALCAVTAAAQDPARINALEHTLQKRPGTERFDSTRFFAQTFLSIGAGPELILYGNDPFDIKRWGASADISFGKWFDAVSGARIGIAGGVLGSVASADKSRAGRSMRFGVTADYLANLASLGWGYDPSRPFELIWLAGIGGHYSMLKSNNSFNWSVRTGAQARFRVTDMTDLYLEPRLTFYGDAIDHNDNWRGFNLAPSLSAGVTYRMVPARKRETSPEFDNGGFLENIFFTVGAGVPVLLGNRMARDNWWDSSGATVTAGIGKWFTSMSGVRLSFAAGYLPWIDVKGKKYRLKVSDISADYMFNANAAFGGYADPQRFQLYLIAGLNAGFPEKEPNTGTAFGAGAGFQAGWRANPNTLLFFEPRLNAYNGRYAGDFTRKNLDLEAQLMVGLTYTRTPEELRHDIRYESYGWGDNIFVTFGAGVQTMAKNSFRDMSLDQAIQPFLTAAIGKWITPYSGLRLRAGAGLIGELNQKSRFARQKMASLGLDYLFNLTRTMAGYDPDARFELTMGAGPSIMMRMGHNHTAKFGAEVSLQPTWYVHPQLGIYLEPRLGLYQHGITEGRSMMANVDLRASLNAGLQWRFKDYDPKRNRSAFDSDDHAGAFFSVGAGVSTLLNTAFRSWRPGPTGMIAVGKEYTPVSAWRLSLSGSILPEINKTRGQRKWLVNGGVEADYLFNILTLAAGYDADRPLGLQAFAGISAGASYSHASLRFVPGAHLGVQGSVSVSPSVSLFVEPRLSLYGKHFENYGNHRNFDVTAGALAGITYRFERREQSAKGEAPAHGRKQFVQADLGASIFGHTFFNRVWNDRFGINASASYGRWLTALSGFRAGVYNSNINRDKYWDSNGGNRFDFTMIGVHADYLLSLTNLVSGTDPERVFELTGIIGAGIDHGKHKKENNWAPSATVGLQGLWNLNSDYALYLEGRGTIYGDKIDGIRVNTGLDGAASLNLGLLYRF